MSFPRIAIVGAGLGGLEDVGSELLLCGLRWGGSQCGDLRELALRHLAAVEREVVQLSSARGWFDLRGGSKIDPLRFRGNYEALDSIFARVWNSSHTGP